MSYQQSYPQNNYQAVSYGAGTGPTYEQEVQSYLDLTSPQRIREQSYTKLPPPEYMERAAHESVTNEHSPARTGRGGSPPQMVSQYSTGSHYY
ncbi:hypothetical protein DIPPA_13889 [Diplonema papillatum]|nr:hypothetical protein DIPPA_13889 [Diplonema papillatum]|eukprot:gene11754-18127_t